MPTCMTGCFAASFTGLAQNVGENVGMSGRRGVKRRGHRDCERSTRSLPKHSSLHFALTHC